MIILTNAQGDVLNTIPDKVYQGSNLANQIIIVSPWSANLQVTIAYKLPNGDFTEPKLMTAFATNPLPENLQANAWSIDIDEPVTENFGLVEFQFKAYNGTQIIATGGCSFTVQHGVAPILPATPSQTIYEQILEAISVLSSTIVAGDFESKALTPYDSTFEYSKYDVIADFQTYGGMYYSLTDNNKGNLPTDTTKWAILPYATLTQLSASIQAHNTNQTAHTDIRTEIANIVNGNTTIEKYQTKDNLVDTWATTPTDSTYPSAKLVKTTIDKIKSDKGLINFVFATKQDFLGWIDGTIEADINGRTTSELQIGSNILIQEENVTDYWCSSISDPLTINDFTPLETELNLSNYLAKDNTSEYNPTGDYNPATKKYADDSGFNNISSLDLSHGEETVTYNTTDGITINGNARKANSDGSTKDFAVEMNIPIVAGDGINIDAKNDNKQIEIKSVTTLVGEADPTTSTVGYIGQLYLNTTDNSTYQCTAISNGSYTWKLVNEDKFVKSMRNPYGSTNTAVYVRRGWSFGQQEDKLETASAEISQGSIMQREFGDPMCKIYTPRPTLNNKYIINIDYLQKYEQCRTGTSDPTSTTVAYYVGQLYLNTTEKTLFKCDSINGSTYTWTSVCENVGTFDSTPTKNSTNPVTSNGIQQALVDNVGVSLQACTTYQQIVDLLNANHNIGYGNIGSSAETTGLRTLLPSIPFDSNFGSVRARIISQGGAMGNNAGLWALEFVLTSDFDAGGETQKPVWHLYVRNSIVSDTDTLYVGEWG